MNVRKLQRIFEKINDLRGSPDNIRPRDLKRLAGRLGRRKVKRGKHDTYTSELLGTTALPIPDHPGSLPKGTALKILGQLEQDAFIWAELIRMFGGNEYGE